MSKAFLLAVLLLFSGESFSKEIALTFDDAPVSASEHFESIKRTEELIRKLRLLKVPEAMVFANPCKDEKTSVSHLKKYVEAGHLIGNHTCSHPRLDDVGFNEYSKDAEKADQLLSPLFIGQKFFRFPFLNESKDEKLRDQIRAWLKTNGYRNGMVSVDNDDYIVSWAINKAKETGKKIDYKKVEKIFLNHLLGAVEFYDDLAVKQLGYSPKHVILLHEVDATVMFIDSLVKELRQRGWKIISAKEAFEDRLYLEQPKNTYANNGIIAQIAMEKTGEKIAYNHFDELKAELVKALGL
ncbi:MAG: polysaccharide deacetylase family protein [Bdellovibrionaceae bacterium]|nr:polysaccharide deacetylase family protein [Pseudobdellovibrionaceae bacterium]